MMKIKGSEIVLVEDMTEEELKEARSGINTKNGVPSEAELVLANDNTNSRKYTPPNGWGSVLNLHKNMDRWAIYRAGVSPTTGNEFAYLRPAMFGGLSYTFLPGRYNDVVEILTNQYGYVQIYAPADQDSCWGQQYPGSPLSGALYTDPEVKEYKPGGSLQDIGKAHLCNKGWNPTPRHQW